MQRYFPIPNIELTKKAFLAFLNGVCHYRLSELKNHPEKAKRLLEEKAKIESAISVAVDVNDLKKNLQNSEETVLFLDYLSLLTAGKFSAIDFLNSNSPKSQAIEIALNSINKIVISSDDYKKTINEKIDKMIPKPEGTEEEREARLKYL